MKRAILYLRLTKPGVTAGNVLTAIAGYFLATNQFGFSWLVFTGMLMGMILVIGGSCALNNYYDRDIDAKMPRTKKRPSVSENLSPLGMVIFSWSLVVAGSVVLLVTTNLLTVVVGLLGFVSYVWLYGRWAKRRSKHGMAVGAIPGALPIVGGYVAASGAVDIGAVIIFLTIFFWQFPEFYSITIYRLKEYVSAGVPVMPAIAGVRSTVIQICVYTMLYVIAALSLTITGYTGWIYSIIIGLPGMYWVYLALKGLTVESKEVAVWARSHFTWSMYTIMLLCLMISVGSYLP